MERGGGSLRRPKRPAHRVTSHTGVTRCHPGHDLPGGRDRGTYFRPASFFRDGGDRPDLFQSGGAAAAQNCKLLPLIAQPWGSLSMFCLWAVISSLLRQGLCCLGAVIGSPRRQGTARASGTRQPVLGRMQPWQRFLSVDALHARERNQSSKANS